MGGARWMDSIEGWEYVDISTFLPELVRIQGFEGTKRILHEFGADRLIFATDYPQVYKVKTENIYKEYFKILDKMEFSESIHIDMSKIAKVNFRRAILKTKVRIYEKDNDASIVFQITTPDTLLYWNGEAIAQQFYEDELGEYKTVKADFWLPRYYTVNSEISTFLWNVGKDSLDVKNIKIHLE